MRVYERAAALERKTTKAFYSDLPKKDARLDSVYSQQRERFKEGDQEMHGKAEIWHTFKSP